MIRRETEGALWTLVLDREARANALSEAMLEQLLAEVEAAHGRAEALILTGEGRVFSAGADLDEVAANGLATSPLWAAVSGALAALPCLTVAALNGTLAGGAFGLALACDIRVAAAHAEFFYPVLARGHLPQRADAARLTALVGPARARLILLAGARLSAQEALAFGLVEAVVPGSEVPALARAFCADTLAAAPGHGAAIKALMPGCGRLGSR